MPVIKKKLAFFDRNSSLPRRYSNPYPADRHNTKIEKIKYLDGLVSNDIPGMTCIMLFDGIIDAPILNIKGMTPQIVINRI